MSHVNASLKANISLFLYFKNSWLFFPWYSVFHWFVHDKFAYGGSILSSSHFLLLSQAPLKATLVIKMVKTDSKKIIISRPWSKFVKQTVYTEKDSFYFLMLDLNRLYCKKQFQKDSTGPLHPWEFMKWTNHLGPLKKLYIYSLFWYYINVIVTLNDANKEVTIHVISVAKTLHIKGVTNFDKLCFLFFKLEIS